jgi:hypothetical protein
MTFQTCLQRKEAQEEGGGGYEQSDRSEGEGICGDSSGDGFFYSLSILLSLSFIDSAGKSCFQVLKTLLC